MKSKGSYRILTPAQMVELIDAVVERDGPCFLRGVIPHECHGKSTAGHLVKQSTLKQARWFKYGAYRKPGESVYRPKPRVLLIPDVETVSLVQIAQDARNAGAICEGIHDRFDNNMAVRRASLVDLPTGFFAFIWAAPSIRTVSSAEKSTFQYSISAGQIEAGNCR